MTRLTKEQWSQIEPHIPKSWVPGRGGRPRQEDRNVLQGILWVLRTGSPWREIPVHCGSPATCWRRFQEWQKKGVFKIIAQAFLSSITDSEERREWSRYIELESNPHIVRKAKKAAERAHQKQAIRSRASFDSPQTSGEANHHPHG